MPQLNAERRSTWIADFLNSQVPREQLSLLQVWAANSIQ